MNDFAQSLIPVDMSADIGRRFGKAELELVRLADIAPEGFREEFFVYLMTFVAATSRPFNSSPGL